MGRTERTLQNGLWGLVHKLIAIVSPFVIRTAIIYYLGGEYLGLNGLYTSILQVLNLAELGFSSAITFSLYKPLAEKDVATVNALMAFYRKVYKCVGLIILGVGITLSPFISHLIKGDIPVGINIYVLYFMYLANASTSYLLFAYKQALLDANQRNDIISKTLALTHTLQYIVQIAALIAFKNYYAYYIVAPIATCIYNIVLSVKVDRMFPQYSPSGKLPKAAIHDLVKRIGGVVIGKVCTTTRSAVASIMLSAILGLMTVAIYTNYFLIVTSVSGIMTVIGVSMSASVGNAMITESEAKCHDQFQTFTFMYAWISVWFAVSMLCLYQPFMLFWVGESYMFPSLMAILFSSYFFLLTSGDIRSVYMNAKGLWWENKWRTIGEAVSNVLFSFLLIRYWGVPGAVIGPLLSLLIFNFFYSTVILYRYCFPSHDKKSYFFNYSIYTVGYVACAVLTYQVCSLCPLTILGFIVRCIICLILPNIILFLLFSHHRYWKKSIAFARQIKSNRQSL